MTQDRKPAADNILADDILNDVVGGVGAVDRDLRMPERFARALNNATSALATAGDGRAQSQRAAQLVKEEAALDDLVKMYRSALREG